MKNERIIEGLNAIIEGATILRDELAGGAEKRNAVESKSATRRQALQKEQPAMNEPEETEATVEGKFSREQLMSMKFNELKKLGASVGVSCKGTRDEIVERMLQVTVSATVENEAEPEETDEAPAKDDGKVLPINKKKGGLKKSAKTEEPEEEEVDEQYIQMATEATEDMSAKEIIEYLAEFDIEAKGKKSDVVKVLAKAIADGIVQLEDDDEDESEEEADVEETTAEAEEETAEDEDGEEFNEESYFPEYDPEGVNNPDGMSEERAEAVKSMMADIIEGVENDTITEEDIQTFLETYASEEELEALGDDYQFEDLVAMYCEVKKRFIDDDGEEHEAGDSYEIDEENYCCGRKLKYEKKSKKFICENCGEEYEAE